LRCIVSRTGNFDAEHPVFKKSGGPIHLLTTGDLAAENPFPRGGDIVHHHQTLEEFLRTLATDHAVKSLHCEGGGQLIRALAEMDAIDEFHLTLAAHTLFGGSKSPTSTGVPSAFLTCSSQFELSHCEPHQELGECFLSYTRIGSDAQ
jgi:riboflavin biosynthesis pyrimidine reductase